MMNIHNILPSSVRNFFVSKKGLRDDDVNWRRDPLSHPDLRAMSQRELADLPFSPEQFLPE